LGTYFSFYAFLWRDVESKVKGFSKSQHDSFMNYREGMDKLLTQQQKEKLQMFRRAKN
jgi:hypothetical protein